MGEGILGKSLGLRVYSVILILGMFFAAIIGISSGISNATAAPADLYLGWRLVIDGAVGTPQSLSFSDLAAMPKDEVNGAIYCGISMVASGNWVGVKISHLLEKTVADPVATNLEFRADDGYVINVAVEAALQQGLIVAYELDGQRLVEVLRLALPGYPGNFWISTITKITVTMSTDYNIGPNYYTTQLGTGHSESVPTPIPTAAPKPTPFRLPTPPPTPQPTSTPQPTPTSTASAPEPTEPSTTPTQSPPAYTPTAPALNGQQTQQDFPSNPTSFANYILPEITAVVVGLVAVGLLFLSRRSKR